MTPRRPTLTFYILSALSIMLLLTWVLLSLISFKTSEKDLLDQKGEQARLLLSSIVLLLPRPLAPPEEGAPAARYVEHLNNDRSFAGLLVVDEAGRELYAVSDRGGADAALLEALKSGRSSFHVSTDRRRVLSYAAIVEQGRVIGAARLSLSLLPERERLSGSRNLFLAYFVLDFLLLLVLGSYLLSHSVVLPVRRLVGATRRIAAGDLDGSVPNRGAREVAELADAYNAMVLALREKQKEVEDKVDSLNRANRELLEARNEAIRSEKMASVGLLAAGMAHEIGTPLAAIMGFSGILSDELSGDPEKSDYLRRISEESRRIDRIVRGLLDYARPRGIEAEDVEVAGLLDKVVELLGAQGALKNLQVSVQVEPDLPPVHADPYQLEQLLINLIMNAKDAMPHGGALSLNGSRRGGEVVIEVADTGQGIAPEHLPLIFDPFFTTKEPGKGTGLGLAIAARIAESCGGRLSVESELGKWSRFTLALPKSKTKRNPD